jgi:hypothetical protein
MTDEFQKMNNTADRILKTSDEILLLLETIRKQMLSFEKNFNEIINKK